MKNIPNIITVFRIAASLILLLLRPFTAIFSLVYILGGLSDLLDGYIARKTKTVSKLGARLDSAADFIMIAVLFVKFVPVIWIPPVVCIWILMIAIIRFLSLLIVAVKFRTFAMLHTYSNKAAGLLLFFLPLLYGKMDIVILSAVICSIAGISALEEMVIHLTSARLDEDRKGLFIK